MEIRLKDASYKDKNFHLQNLNVLIESNKVTAFVGNGKTTLLEILLGLRKITGNIYIDGEKVEKTKEIISRVSYIVENPETQFIYKTVLQECERAEKNYTRIIEVLSVFGLKEDILSKNPTILSNGEKRKLALSLAILKNSSLIVIDEPALGLDHQMANKFAKIIRNLRKSVTIVIATNDVDFVHKVADNVFVVANNEIIYAGDKYKVFKEEEILKKYGIDVPDLIKFVNIANKEKEIKMGYRDEINDLMKDIYRYVK